MDTSEDGEVQLQLSSSLHGAESCIRDVAAHGDDLLCTAEERGFISIWQREGEKDFVKHTGWVQDPHIHEKGLLFCVAAVPGAQDYPEGTFITGGADKTARAFSMGGVERVSLIGHTNCVNSVCTTLDGRVVTGSWDGTIKVWEKGQATHSLTGHEYAVEVLVLETGELVSASANKSIIIFDSNFKPIKTIPNAHDHAIRKLIKHPLGFASCGNDGFLRVWSQRGDKLLEIASHINAEPKFIYSLTRLHSGEMVACGEDCSVRVWSADGSTLKQTLMHPGPVRAVLTLPNGDLVTACADKVCRIFTRVASRVAGDDEIAEFDNFVQMTVTSKGMDGIDQDTLPDESILLKPGAKDGAVKVVKVAGRGAIVYKWQQASMEWEELGEAVGRKKRAEVAGVEYDHVTDVFVTDTQSVPLGFNRDDDPDDVAARFCTQYGLDVDMRGQVAEHVRPLTDPAALTTRKLNEKALKNAVSLKHIPSWSTGGFIVDSEIKLTAFKRKLFQLSAEFRQGPTPEHALNGDEEQTVFALEKNLENKAAYHSLTLSPAEIALVTKLFRWPSAQVLPVMDSYRTLMCLASGCSKLGGEDFRRQLLSMAVVGKASHQTLCLRGLSNWICKRERPSAERAGTVDKAMLTFLQDALDDLAGVASSENAAALHAYVMFLYNLECWFGRLGLSASDLHISVVTGLVQVMDKVAAGTLKDKTVFYALITLGTVGHCCETAKDLVCDAYADRVRAALRLTKSAPSAALREVAEDCVRVFNLPG
jgi:hypothetical protein